MAMAFEITSPAAAYTVQGSNPPDAGDDKATTLMFRHLPRKYTAEDLLAVLEQYVTRSAMDFVYVPWDRSSTNNMGYAFANFVDAPTARMIIARMDGTCWPNDRRMRGMKVVLANLQGFVTNLAKYVATSTTPHPTHCPLIFYQGKQVPLNVAIHHFLRAPSQPAPQQELSASVGIAQPAGLHQFAPARQAVVPPPGLSFEDLAARGPCARPVPQGPGGTPPPSAPRSPPAQVPEHHFQGVNWSGGLAEPAQYVFKQDHRQAAKSASGFSSCSTTASPGISPRDSPRTERILESQAYAASRSRVQDLLAQLQRAGAF